MNDNTKLEIAIEIMAAKISKTIRDGAKPEDKIMKDLLEERMKMYKGDQNTIDKIIEVYGKELNK